MAEMATTPKRSGLAGLLRRFVSNEDGATVVEFALIGLPFLTMIMATLEITTSYFVTIQLENGLETADQNGTRLLDTRFCKVEIGTSRRTGCGSVAI